MFSLNRATILGNLTRDPELRYIPSGQAVASYAVATNRRWTTPGGEAQEETQFHEVVAWGKLAEVSQQLLSKGKKVYIEGRIQTRSWEAADGTKRNRTEIVAENIIALSPRQGGSDSAADNFPGSDSSSTAKPKTSTAKTKKDATDDSSVFAGNDDSEIKLEDIPF